ncbi:uncharacterized protein Dwil_GK27773 [Drosophila willistoni]|uniref:Uncharacterized protein n=1 Tax=Drosophila willistoni TaxID=7260 RepID=A0A0Q9X0A6_DROWI|nr:uncharacterized protein Dwil_GK27773 [Drosophila willistoni]
MENNTNTNKTAGIWNSVPDLDGSNGALKALAKNVANHMKLNRPEMKRVVAKVVAERHGLGDVGDYKGYMYYAKPDRINMNQLIAQSKVAFDEMMQQQRHRENLQQQKQNGQQQQQRKALGKMTEGNRRSQSGGGGGGVGGPSKKKAVSRKSSTAVFQLQNWGHKSLNGVIIDETHLPRGGKEILLAVNRRMVAMDPGSNKKKKKTKMPSAVPVKKLPRKLKPTSAMKKTSSSSSSSTTRPPVVVKKASVRKIPAKGAANPIVPKVVDLPPSPLKDEAYRLPAGSSFHPLPANPIESDTKKPSARSKSKISINQKQTVQRQRNYDKPWLVGRHKRHNRHKTEGGGGGGAPAAAAVGAGGDAEGLDKSSGRKLPSPALKRPRTRVSHQSAGGAGATNQKLKEAPSKFNVSKTAISSRANPKPKGGKSKTKQVKQQSQAVSTSQGSRKETNTTTPQNRGSRANKVFQARLIKDMLREEAIDEPERLEAGSIRRPTRGGKKRREKKPKMDAHQQQEEEEDADAAATVIEVCADKAMQQQAKPSKASKTKLKVKPKDKPAPKNSRFKRIPKVANSSPKDSSPKAANSKAANSKAANSKAASPKAASPKATFALASPQNHPSTKPINPHPKPRYLLRTRRVPVASSLGSIGNLRTTSKDILFSELNWDTLLREILHEV